MEFWAFQSETQSFCPALCADDFLPAGIVSWLRGGGGGVWVDADRSGPEQTSHSEQQ